MIYFIYKNGTVYGSTEFEDAIADIAFANGLEDYEIGQTEFEDYTPHNKKYLLKNGEIVLNPDFEELQATLRETSFKSQFFEIGNWGWFRKVPKGYSSAVEAMSAAFNMVTILGFLPANTLTFYAAPDFTDETECTETWLVDNSIKNSELPATDFGALYAQFLQAWNEIEHYKEMT